MRSFYAPPPLIGEITDFNSISCAEAAVAKIGTQEYDTLQAALTATKDGDTITLLDNFTISTRHNITKSITLDGNDKTITITSDRINIPYEGDGITNNMEVTIKNLTINSKQICLYAYTDFLKSLKLENVKLLAQGANDTAKTYPLTLGDNTSANSSKSEVPEITITDCTIQSHPDCKAGYAIMTAAPAKLNITGSTIKGWGCLYSNNNYGSPTLIGSKGSSYVIDKCTFISKNLNAGDTNAFGCIIIQDKNVQVTVTNTKIDVSGTNNEQNVVTFNTATGTEANPDYHDCSGSVVTLGAGNTVSMKEDASILSNYKIKDGYQTGTLIITGGTFDKDPSEYVDTTKYAVVTKDSSYTVKEIVTGAVVSADNKSKVYGESDPTLTASLVNVSDDDKSLVKYTISRAAGDDAGTYAITVTGDSAQLQYKNITYKNGTFTITKAESSLTKAPAAVSNLAYTGSAQALVTAGTATGGTIQYVLGTDSTTAPTSGFKADIPTGTDAATYYVWYKVAGDKNHNDTTPSCITVSITNAGSSIADQSITVTKGTTTTLAVKDSSGSGSRTWALSNGAPSWVTLKKDSDSQATLTIAPDLEVNADTYICSVTVTNADNNTATGKVSITVEPTVDDALADMSEEEKEAITDLDELLTPEQKVELTDSQLEKIVEELPNLAKVDLSGAVNLTKVDMKGSTSLTTINFEGCTSLTKVNLGGCNSLTSIGGLKNNTSITEVDTSACSSLESLDVSGCTSLTSLDCSAGSIGTLNVTGCDSLAYLDCSGNKLEKLEVSSPALEDLNCGSNGLLNMDVKNSFKLKNLNCRGNSMAALDIDASKFTALETIDCSGQEISELSVTEESGYQVVDIWGYIAKFFARLFSGSTSSTVTISLNADTAAELSNIADVKAYGEDGREIISNYDASTGVVNLSEVPSRVSYKYKTGYENVSMDVSIGETITPEEHDTTLGNSSGSGGCSAGYGIFSVSALLLMFAMFTARKHS